MLHNKGNVSEYDSTCNQITCRPVGRPGDLALRPHHLTPPESDVRISHMDSLPAGTKDLSVSARSPWFRPVKNFYLDLARG